MKNITRILLLTSIALTLGACGSTSNNANTSAEYASNEDYESDDMVCKLEKKIGSNRMHRVCYTVEERERMREAGREGWLRMQRGTETSGGDL